MANLSEVLSGTITSVGQATQGAPITKIRQFCFLNCQNFTELYVKDGLESIGPMAFCNTGETLTIDLANKDKGAQQTVFLKSICCNYKNMSSNMDLFYGFYDNVHSDKTVNFGLMAEPDCAVSVLSVVGCNFVNTVYGATEGAATISTRKRDEDDTNKLILMNCTQADTTAAYWNDVISVASGAFLLTGISTLVLPPNTEYIWGPVTRGGSVTTVDVPEKVSFMARGTMDDTSVTTWVFRQPAGMTITMPSSYLGYNKNSRTITVYTDNESIANYGWASDNITANIYPLSSYTG